MRRRPKAAFQESAGLEEIEVELCLLGILRQYGYDFRGYAPELVRKEILRRMEEEGLDSVSRLTEQMLRRPGILERFISQFSEADASLFEPIGFWRSFRKKVVPFLRTYPTLRIWLAGGRPEDLYSLSIILAEDVPRNVQIYATDIHESLLARAREGGLSSRRLSGGVKGYRGSGGKRDLVSYFEQSNGTAVLSPALRKKILFASHNPVTDGSFQRCQVVLARRVLRTFTEDLRNRTYRLLHGSLVPLGFLALGPEDDLRQSPVKDCYREVDRPGKLFQKLKD